MRFVGETEFVDGVAAMAASGRYGPMLACEGIVGRRRPRRGRVGRGGAGRPHPRRRRPLRAYATPAPTTRAPTSATGHTNPPPGLYGLAAFREGFARLAPLGLSFEAWQYHPQLGEVTSLADAFPETTILLNHVGGPLGIGPYAGRRDEVFADWRRGIRDLADCPNVVVKLGGLGMAVCGFGFHRREIAADLRGTGRGLAALYRDLHRGRSAPERGMFESNFPVDRVSCGYADAVERLQAPRRRRLGGREGAPLQGDRAAVLPARLISRRPVGRPWSAAPPTESSPSAHRRRGRWP